MLSSKAEKYRQLIKKSTRRQMIFAKIDNQGRKPIVKRRSNFILPQRYPIKSSQQIQKNTLTIPIQQLHHSTQTQEITSQYNWPCSCIGLILCQHHQNNKIYYVYGTGTLIHNKIVLTSAQNVYCRRLHRQYVNIKFITGVNGNKCSGIYDVIRVHYPKEYKKQKGYNNFDFAVLQIYDDLSESCGYISWKLDYKTEGKDTNIYGYIIDYQQRSFNLKQLKKQQKLKQHEIICSGSVGLIKEGNQYHILELWISQTKILNLLSNEIRDIVNQWVSITRLKIEQRDLSESCDDIVKFAMKDLRQIILRNNIIVQASNNIAAQGCKFLSQANWIHLNKINLYYNKIGIQGCKYLLQADWKHLTSIDLTKNNISSKGCKYLSQANWPHLHNIGLSQNKIDAQGCKYLRQANWIFLKSINLQRNIIYSKGCKYLSQANWSCLTNISLFYNEICIQGCKYPSQANWTYLTNINLCNYLILSEYNKIGVQGCKYLSQTNCPNLTNINLYNNEISAQGCKYLSQANWTHLSHIELSFNNIYSQGCKYISQVNWQQLISINLIKSNIDEEGCKYLIQGNWTHSISIDLRFNNIDKLINEMIIKMLWSKVKL